MNANAAGEDRTRAYIDSVLGKSPQGAPPDEEVEAAKRGHYVLDIPNEIPDLDDWPDRPIAPAGKP